MLWVVFPPVCEVVEGNVIVTRSNLVPAGAPSNFHTRFRSGFIRIIRILLLWLRLAPHQPRLSSSICLRDIGASWSTLTESGLPLARILIQLDRWPRKALPHASAHRRRSDCASSSSAASTNASRRANEVGSSVVHPNTSPPNASGATLSDDSPSRRCSIHLPTRSPAGADDSWNRMRKTCTLT